MAAAELKQAANKIPPIEERSCNNDVPAKLIKAAIRLYGRHGCHAVSARQIIKEAAVLNDAAIRYYFGGREDLLKACVHEIGRQTNPIMQQCWQRLEAKKASLSVTARDIVSTQFMGWLQLYQQNPEALLLLTRMIREEGPVGQRLQLRELGSTIWRFEAELAAVLPEKSAKALRMQVVITITTMAYSLIDHELLNTLPAQPGGDEFFNLEPDEMTQGFIDFLTVGLAGPCSV